MENVTIPAGSLVRYPRTGTSGKAGNTKIIDGMEFVLVESSGMYYRGEEEGLERFKGQKDLSSEEIRDAFDDVTGVGAG